MFFGLLLLAMIVIITSAKEYVFVIVSLFVCYQLCAKTSRRICMKFSENVDNGPVNKCLNFSGDPDHRLDTGIVFRICHYWEIRKVVNGDKSAAHTDSPDGGAGIRRALAEVCYFSSLIFCNNKAQAVVQNQLLFIIVL